MRIPGHQKRSYTWRWTAAFAGLAVVTFALVMALVVAPAERAQAAAFTVNVTTDAADEDDDGSGAGTAGDGIVNGTEAPDGTCDSDGAAGSQCSLRAALFEALATSGVPDTIGFSITGAGPHTITVGPAHPLPPIDDDYLTINGGAEVIVLKPAVGVGGAAFLEIDADNVTIQNLILDGENDTMDGILVVTNNDEATIDGVEIKDFDGHAILFNQNNDDNLVDQAYIHDNTGTGIVVDTDSDDNTIRNSTIEDNGDDGIDLNDGSGNEITGNTIEDNGNAGGDEGIEALDQSGLVISNNTLSDNSDNQISIGGGATGVVTIKNNLIDVDSDGIELDTTCKCDDVKINGGTDAEANCFTGPLGADEYYLENMSGEDVDADHNDWAGDTTPGDKICASDQTNLDCETGAAPPPPPVGSDVDWDPVAPACAGPATATPVATNTPSVTSTPTPGTPTSTPTATGTPATATPTATPVMESKALVVGCNPLASTYPDNTAISTIAAAVSPSGALISIWSFETGIWRGYSPFYPEYSDLSEVDRLDVVFICVDTAGSFQRPQV